MAFYIIVAARLILGLLALVLVTNLTRKGNLAPASASDQVQNYVLGGTVNEVIYNTNIPIPIFILILAVWFAVVLSLRQLKKHNNLVKKSVDGRPMMLVPRSKTDADAVCKVGTSANDPSFKLRMQGIYVMKDARQATFERDGQPIIISFGEENPRYPLITDGNIQPATLEMVGKDKDWLLVESKTQGMTDVGTVFPMEYDSGKTTVTEYGQ